MILKKKSSIFHKLICQCHFDRPYEAIGLSDGPPQAHGPHDRPPEAHGPPKLHGPRGRCPPLPPLSEALVKRWNQSNTVHKVNKTFQTKTNLAFGIHL